MEQIDEGMKMNLAFNHQEKVFSVEMDGFAKIEQGSNIVQKYKEIVSKLNIKEYTLIIDCRKLQTFLPDLLPYLEMCYIMHMSIGYKSIILVNPANITSKMQLQRVGKKVNFEGVFVQTVEEAWSLANTPKIPQSA